MGSKKELTYVLDLRYYSILSSIVPQLRYNYKLGYLESFFCQQENPVYSVVMPLYGK
ncbi:hypothetical protein QUA44_12725 [Microcoleus sp. N9_A2]|uniref:hypothetical protein n=1 Tax=unclassified Microcoleus TaxID=2642155 RepID=UPI002FD38794